MKNVKWERCFVGGCEFLCIYQNRLMKRRGVDFGEIYKKHFPFCIRGVVWRANS